jgi:hypothetical protein
MPRNARPPRARRRSKEDAVLTDELVDNAQNIVFLNEQIKDEWTKLVAAVPVFHISQRTLAGLEIAAIPIDTRLIGERGFAFAIAIDDAIEVERPHVASGSAKTEVLLLDGRAKIWRFYERSRIVWPHDTLGSQVVGAVWGLRKKRYGPQGSYALGYGSAGEYHPWEVTREDTARIIHALLSMRWLVHHDEVAVSDVAVINGQQHVIVNVPETLNVGAAIADLLAGKHVRKQPSRINALVRALVKLVKTALFSAERERNTQ